MPSQLALAIAKRNKETTDTVGALRLATDADAELQEVRKVLDLFEEEWMTPHDHEHEIEFLPKDVECDQCDLSKRARALIRRLRVDGGKG
jgi:hypothetical protein